MADILDSHKDKKFQGGVRAPSSFQEISGPGVRNPSDKYNSSKQKNLSIGRSKK